MSSLRLACIRLAHTNPALRPHLLPMLKASFWLDLDPVRSEEDYATFTAMKQRLDKRYNLIHTSTARIPEAKAQIQGLVMEVQSLEGNFQTRRLQDEHEAALLKLDQQLELDSQEDPVQAQRKYNRAFAEIQVAFKQKVKSVQEQDTKVGEKRKALKLEIRRLEEVVRQMGDNLREDYPAALTSRLLKRDFGLTYSYEDWLAGKRLPASARELRKHMEAAGLR